MSATNYTPIYLYNSGTATNTPSASNLGAGELAINYADGKLFYKDGSAAVQVIGWKTTPTTAGGTGLTSYTIGDLPYYANGSALSKLGIGTSGYVLQSNGSAPTWVAQSTLSVGTATNATNTAITDNTSSSATWYPTIVSATTGNLPQTTSSTKLSFVPSTGVLSATSFSGAGTGLTGTASSLSIGGNAANVTGTVAIANGGTGVTTLTGVAYGNGTSAFTAATGSQIATAIGSTAVTNATNATNVGTTDNTSSSSTYYPTLVSATSGNNPITTSSTKLSFVPSTGTLTATSHAGAWAGSTIGTTYGGTGLTSFTANGVVYASSTSALTTGSALVFDGTNLLVGQSSTIGTGGRVQVISNTDTLYSQTSSNTTYAALVLNVQNTSARLAAFQYGNTTNVGTITTNGTTTSYNVTSDRRLKENIAPFNNGLQTISALKPCQYNYISDKEVTYQGFIADELQSVVPQAVTGKVNEVDAEGKPIYQGVDASFLIPHLVSAIQELKAEFDNLKAQINGASA